MSFAFIAVSDWAIALLIVAGLAACVFTDQMQLVAKAAGAINGRVASGYNSAMKIMVLNRVGAVLFFTSSSMFIETSAAPKAIAEIYIVGVMASIFLIAMMLMFYVRKGVLQVNSLPSRNLWGWSALANAFSMLGLTVPYIFASSFLDFRLVLTNLSFLFNTIYTVVMVFVVENSLAKIIDENGDELRPTAGWIVIGRLIGYIITLVALIILEKSR